VHRKSGKFTEIRTQHWVGLGPANFNGDCSQIVDPISKISPISDLLSYKDCLSVERPRTLGDESKKRKKLLLKNRKIRVGRGKITVNNSCHKI